MKKCLPPDNRLNWRDSNMPVYARVIDPNTGEVVMTSFHPETITDYYKHKMSDPRYGAPGWRDDPTYDLRSKRKR